MIEMTEDTEQDLTVLIDGKEVNFLKGSFSFKLNTFHDRPFLKSAKFLAFSDQVPMFMKEHCEIKTIQCGIEMTQMMQISIRFINDRQAYGEIGFWVMLD